MRISDWSSDVCSSDLVDIYYSRVATKLPPPRGNPRNQRLDGDLNPFHLDTQINNGDAAMQDQVWWVTGASSGPRRRARRRAASRRRGRADRIPGAPQIGRAHV